MSIDTTKTFTIEDALRINTFADRAPVRLSAGGRFLAYTIENRNGEAVQEQVWVTDIDTGKRWQVLPEALKSYLAGWSPTEPVLAFVADMGEGPRLWVHSAETNETRQVSPAALAYYEYLRFYLPQWLPDGSALICTLSSRIGQPGYDNLGQRISRKAAPVEEVAEGGISVRSWESPPKGDTPGDASAISLSERYRSTLARIDLCDGTLTPLVNDIACASWAVSPDGQNAAYLQYIYSESWPYCFRLCVVPTSGGEVRVLDPNVLEAYAVSISWSPDSAKIAYCPNHEVAVVSLDDAKSRVVMPFPKGVEDEFYEAPLWSNDGTFLLATKNGCVWRIPVDGGDPINLMPNSGTVYARGITAPGGGPSLWSPDGESTFIEVRNGANGEIGLARISLSGAGILHSTLSMQMLSDVPRYHLDISPTRSLISFVRQSATCPADVWVTDASLSSPHRVTTLNPHMDGSQFSMPRLIKWTGPDGCEYRSAYFPPVNVSEQPHPVILCVYEGRQSSFLSSFGSHIQIFTSHGYGVCLPDQIYMSPENRAEALRGMLACAVKSLITEGIADPARIGIFGHSLGGYIVNAAITGLDCFAAAVSSTGFTNFTSLHGIPSDSGNSSWAESVESGRLHMGVPPWENPQPYIENSPLFSLDRVTTPVLIVHGDKDACISQAWEMFNGLRRLNKPASLAIYQGEGHAQCDWRRPNVIDYWQRMLGWFDRHMTVKGSL